MKNKRSGNKEILGRTGETNGMLGMMLIFYHKHCLGIVTGKLHLPFSGEQSVLVDRGVVVSTAIRPYSVIILCPAKSKT